MPLMGNPSLAAVLYGPSVTFNVNAVTQTVAAVTPIATGSVVNMTEVVEEQKADQMGMDSTMPRNLYLAFAGLLLLCMIISHPRFLARLFASLHSSSKTQKDTSVKVYPYTPESLKALHVKRTPGGGDLKKGWLLRKGQDKQIQLQSPLNTPSSVHSKTDYFASPVSEKALSPININVPSISSTTSSPPTFYPPPHMVPLLHNLPFQSTLLLTPFSRLPSHLKSYLTLPQLYIITGYLILTAFALVWKSDLSPQTKDKGYGADWMRSGLVATCQIPLVIALGVRGNIIGLCVGKGYERLKVYHKIVGRVVFLASTVHAAAYMYKWTVAGKFSTYAAKPFAMYGLLAYFALVLIVITSLPWVRKAWHGIFEICHFVGIAGLLVGLALHVPVAIPFCIAAAIIYLISILCSLTKTRLAHAELHALPGAATTVVTIPALRSGWRAGQHVRIRIPALGPSKGFESHPFTIASAPDGEGLVLMCKRAGDWTDKLYELAQRSSDIEDRAEGGKNNATVILEGPYGGLGNTLLPSFSSVVLVAGGSGITQALGLAHDLVSRAPTGVVRARTIDLIWMVRTEDTAKPLMATLLELVDEAKQWEMQCLDGRRKGEKRPVPTALRVKIFITRSPASSPLNLLPEINDWRIEQDKSIKFGFGSGFGHEDGLKRQPSAAEKEKYEYLFRNPSTSSSSTSASTISSISTMRHDSPLSTISVNPIRPDFNIFLSSLADETISRYGKMMIDPSGICVTACGPNGLVENVRNSVRNLQDYKKRGCGGIEFEEEHFGF
ncbi:uncharacterized protein IL334_005602 [Kwoniella shivajii]|uniref:ferric-chelate reductase (NADPH) n=1 Tax=Kwoniella shivajii TaxID=564305 RepID=A0ABZ1D548_9TREE|nr:hypothetical protein IL334_005602 [Kwoniella shivajii]